LINRRNVKADPHKAYQADKAFVLLELEARVVVAAMKMFGMETQLDTPNACPIPEKLGEQSRTDKIKYLHNAAAKVVDEIIVDSNDIL
jgi:hypothetical protein